MPRDGSATRTRILDTAERLAIDHGFSATSLERIIEESATSKGAFFHHFSSKADLAGALVQRYAAGDIAQLDRGLAAVADVEGAGPRLVAFIEHFEDEADDLMAEQSSCLYVAALTERELIDTGTTAPIEKVVLAWRSAIAAMVGDALSEKGIAAPEVDVDALADHVFVTFEGAFILCRATNDPSHMRRQLGALRVLVDGLLG